MVLSPAKLNLSLKVYNLLDNGYHSISSYVFFLDLFDKLFIRKSSQNSVVNVQNNTNQNNSQSTATNVSGFLDHEPDTSFKYVRRSNGDEYI